MDGGLREEVRDHGVVEVGAMAGGLIRGKDKELGDALA